MKKKGGKTMKIYTNIKKVCIILLLGTIIFFFGFLSVPAYAAVDKESRAGFKKPETMVAGQIEASQIYYKKTSTPYSSPWESYSTYYYYNQMSSNEKKLYDRLNAMCLSYLVGNEDFKDYKGELVTPYVATSGLSKEEALEVTTIFTYSNPQYYFLSTYRVYGFRNGDFYIAIGVYEDFKIGTTRKATTNQLSNKIQEYYSQINPQATAYEKEIALHNLLIENVSYEYGTYDQSIYSVFFQNESVCAGYAKAFELLCNGQGIDCALITSDVHAWNKVRMNDSWYTVDCTWDDTDVEGYLDYTFLNRSNSMLQILDWEGNHEEEAIWDGYGPKCTLDSGATKTSYGVLAEPITQTLVPRISLDYSEGQTTVSLTSDTSGAVLYYTLGDVTPSEAYTKSIRYTGPFTLQISRTLQIIAVYNSFKDSQVVSQKVDIRVNSAIKPTIITQPKSGIYRYGNKPKALSVVVAPDNMVNVTYQWYEVNPTTGAVSPIVGATKASYVPPANKIGTYYFQCYVTNRDEAALYKKEVNVKSSTAKVVINRVDLSLCKVTGISAKTYTGKLQTQSPKVTYNGVVLIKNRDYRLSYVGNRIVGTAKCYIIGMGCYSGKKIYKFYINPPKTAIYSVKNGSKKATLSWKTNKLISGYQIQYAYNNKFSSSKVSTLKGYKKNSYTLSKLKVKSICYIRIRTYKTVSGKNYYSAWSTPLKIKVK